MTFECVGRWTSCLKHEIISLQFPAAQSDYIFAGGADQDLRCNLVHSKARKAAAKTLPEALSRCVPLTLASKAPSQCVRLSLWQVFHVVISASRAQNYKQQSVVL